VLLQSGRLIDTLAHTVLPEDDPVVHPEPRAALARMVQHIDSAGLETVVVRGGARLDTLPGTPVGVVEEAVLGEANTSEPAPASPLAWSHGFVCRRVRLAPGTRTPALRRRDAEVIFVHSGTLELEVEGEHAQLAPGDTVTVPVGAIRRVSSRTGADLFVTRAGDAPASAEVAYEATA
jgi:quercetin dioxygenase-like cupin family protein